MMKKLALIIAFFATFSVTCYADNEGKSPDPVSQEITLPSALPSGFASNDTIYFTYYAPQPIPTTGGAPAVILLHYLGAKNTKDLDASALYAARRGVAAAVVTLPYHLRRGVAGISSYERYISPNADMIAQASQQCVSDVRTVTDWLVKRPEVDPQRLGIVGASLGALITHLAMGQDARLRAGVAFEAGGDLAEVNRFSLFRKLLFRNRKPFTNEEIAKLNTVDPLTYASQNQPRHVLMVQAARDAVIPPHTGEKLWRALGRPPIQWIDTNHVALRLVPKSTARTALAYLEAVWNNDEAALARVPKVRVPTIKAGFLTGLDSRLTPAVQWQAVSLGKRRHMSLLSANLGLSGRGPFVGFAATVNAFVDAGLAHRLIHGQGFTPYLSFHLVF